jgi:hypothetical protein
MPRVRIATFGVVGVVVCAGLLVLHGKRDPTPEATDTKPRFQPTKAPAVPIPESAPTEIASAAPTAADQKMQAEDLHIQQFRRLPHHTAATEVEKLVGKADKRVSTSPRDGSYMDEYHLEDGTRLRIWYEGHHIWEMRHEDEVLLEGSRFRG